MDFVFKLYVFLSYDSTYHMMANVDVLNFLVSFMYVAGLNLSQPLLASLTILPIYISSKGYER